MKKILAIVLALVLIIALAACGDKTTSTNTSDTPGSSAPESTAPESTASSSTAPESNTPDSNESTPASNVPESTAPDTSPSGQAEGFELALITDLGSIDDKSFNQGSWEGLEKYAKENNITYKYYQPADQGDDFYLNAIDLAVAGGAKVIVTPGYLFEVPVFIAQDRYPDVHFILIDGEPQAGDYEDYRTNPNAVGVLYAEEQAGFLAGYAAVMDGYRKLGFMGGIAVPAVVRFGHGYVQGAETAAQTLGLEDGSVSLNYYYTGAFWPEPEIATRAAAWYNDGIEVIFSCGGGILFSIAPAAENSGNVVIGVDVDQYAESSAIITSAMKQLAVSVYDCIKAYYDGSFPGGKTLIYSAVNNGVGLPMVNSKFNTFTQADYDAIFAQLVSGAVVVDNNIEITPDQIPASAVVVNYLG